jgi:hypothetical protein
LPFPELFEASSNLSGARRAAEGDPDDESSEDDDYEDEGEEDVDLDDDFEESAPDDTEEEQQAAAGAAMPPKKGTPKKSKTPSNKQSAGVSSADTPNVSGLSDNLAGLSLIEGRNKSVPLADFLYSPYFTIYQSWDNEEGQWYVDYEMYLPPVEQDDIHAQISSDGQQITGKVTVPKRFFSHRGAALGSYTMLQNYGTTIDTSHRRFKAKTDHIRAKLESNNMDLNADVFKVPFSIDLPFKCEQQFVDEMNHDGQRGFYLDFYEIPGTEPQEYDYVLHMKVRAAAKPRQVLQGNKKKLKRQGQPVPGKAGTKRGGEDDDAMGDEDG